MKKRVMWALVMAMAVTSGCVNSTELIKANSISTRNDVFQELTDKGSIPQGYADLKIAFSIKTHNPGIYSAKDIHGTPDYKLLLNIDGQVLQLQGSLRKENSDTMVRRDTEAGEGISIVSGIRMLPWLNWDVAFNATSKMITATAGGPIRATAASLIPMDMTISMG